MAPTVEPEIRRCTLTSSLLQLKCLNQDLEELDFMDKPDAESVAAALKTLFAWAVVNRKLPANPAAGLTIKLGKRPRVRPKGFVEAEAHASSTMPRSSR